MKDLLIWRMQRCFYQKLINKMSVIDSNPFSPNHIAGFFDHQYFRKNQSISLILSLEIFNKGRKS